MTRRAPGQLHVTAVADHVGRTRMATLTQSYPQRVTTPLYADADPRAACLCVQSPSGGIFPDDVLRTSVSAHSGSHLLLTTQAANQVFDGEGPGARHELSFQSLPGSDIEYLPRTTVPHAGSRYTQRTEVHVRGDGIFAGWDAYAAGRIGHGEKYTYRHLEARLQILVDGVVTVRDRIDLSTTPNRNPARLIGGDYFASLFVVAPAHPGLRALLDDVRHVIDREPDIAGAASTLPAETGIVVRIIANRAPPLHGTMRDLVSAYRSTLLSLAAPPTCLV